MLKFNTQPLKTEDILFAVVWIMTALGLNFYYLKEFLQIVLLIYLICKNRFRILINSTILTRLLFTTWCGASIIWATYTNVSISRTFSVIQTFILLYASMLYVYNEKNLIMLQI